MGCDDIDAACFSWHTVECYPSVPSLLFPFTSAIFSAMPLETNVYEYLMYTPPPGMESHRSDRSSYYIPDRFLCRYEKQLVLV